MARARSSSNLGLNIAGPTPTLLGFNAGPNFGTFQQGNNLSLSLNPFGGSRWSTLTARTPLPPGFGLEAGPSLLSNGTPGTDYLLVGTPLVPGSFAFVIEARDTLGNVGARTFALTVAPLYADDLKDAARRVRSGSPYRKAS